MLMRRYFSLTQPRIGCFLGEFYGVKLDKFSQTRAKCGGSLYVVLYFKYVLVMLEPECINGKEECLDKHQY